MTFVSVLNSFGFRKVPWNRCQQGFEKRNYPCYSRKDKNVWCELYLGDTIPYGWIIGEGIASGGVCFDEPKQLYNLLKQTNQ